MQSEDHRRTALQYPLFIGPYAAANNKLIRYLVDLLRSLWPRKVADASKQNNGGALVGVFVRLTDIH